MMFGNVEIIGMACQIFTHIKIIKSAGNDSHSRMGSDGFTGKRKFGFSLIDDFTRTAFLAILFSHPFDDSFLVDWPRLRSQNHN
jgi:hypothetical protein